MLRAREPIHPGGELQKSWPIDREYVLARDPELASVDARLLPWNED